MARNFLRSVDRQLKQIQVSSLRKLRSWGDGTFVDIMSPASLAVSPNLAVAACLTTISLSGCHSSWDFLLYSLSSSAGISGVIQWSDSCRLIHAIANNGYVYQLDAIPTVGFSDPILSYFSALQFSVDGVRMLREGYKKVIYLSFCYMHPFLEPN